MLKSAKTLSGKMGEGFAFVVVRCVVDKAKRHGSSFDCMPSRTRTGKKKKKRLKNLIKQLRQPFSGKMLHELAQNSK